MGRFHLRIPYVLMAAALCSGSGVLGMSFQHGSYLDQLVDPREGLRRGDYPPQIIESGGELHNRIWGVEGSWKEFGCNVRSLPVAEFTWLYRGEKINPVSNTSSLEIATFDNLSILKVKVEESTIGEFTCRAENELGAVELNFFLGRGAKPLIPDFETIVVPDQGILVQVTQFLDTHRRNINPLALNISESPESREELGEILPIKGYTIQLRRMKSCDPWRNITSHSEKQFIKSHELVPGTVYRMRMATRTDVGLGEFSRAKTVNYRLSDDAEEVVQELAASGSPRQSTVYVHLSNDT